jgi:hypothetical protein
MRISFGLFGLVVLAAAMSFGAMADAAAQTTPPAKPGVVTPPHEASPADDFFAPPMRGTPGGRISGGTRGLGKPTGATPPPPPAAGGVKTTQGALLPVSR